jgi:hypothetical protein
VYTPITTLPLKNGGNIVQGNATRLEWAEVCPKVEGDEIYILGNPPYLGFLQQTKLQKQDMDIVFANHDNIKKLDYISCWFYKGSNYINNFNAKLAFVSTNSIIQGEQVALFWPYILNKLNIEIGFAYQSFLWVNNAKYNAGITCVIIGLRVISPEKKYIFSKNIKLEVSNINAYLSPTKNIFITKLNKPLSDFPTISLGSSAYDGGFLMITPDEKNEIISEYPNLEFLFKRFIGSAEFVRGIERYCLWIHDKDIDYANSIPKINARLQNVKEFRANSKRGKTLETASTPNRFTEDRHLDKPSIIVPIVTSERREYLTLGFLNNGEVIPNSARAIYDAKEYIFGILSSKIHMIWVKAVGGRLRTDVRYSAGVCYNSFPFPKITQTQKDEIEELVNIILDERAANYLKTMAELYDPEKMPEGLKTAHHNLDMYIEKCYRDKPFESDEERLEHLFKLYEKMIKEEKNITK